MIGGILIAIPAFWASHLLREADKTSRSIHPQGGHQNEELGREIADKIRTIATGWNPWHHRMLITGLVCMLLSLALRTFHSLTG